MLKDEEEINRFLKQKLDIELHLDKSKIIILGNRLTFLGLRMFYYHRLLKKSNLRKMQKHFGILKSEYKENLIDYDKVYDFLEGWIAYAKNADSYNLRSKILSDFESKFPSKVSTKEINRYFKMQKK